MKKIIYIVILSFLNVVVINASSIKAKPQSVGLVLSGGGAKGIAHIGVIQALEENNIPIDYITGTSIGAIVGGLYAIGYSPQEMLELIYSPNFEYWSTGRINEKLVYYFVKDRANPAILKLPIKKKKSSKTTSILPSSIISPLPMNLAFMELFSAYSAQCDENFDNLFVPFRCVASDVVNNRKIVCSQGALGEAIRASMTFPVVFQPIKMDGMYVYDGGIYDNFPVDVMRSDFSPSIMIGVDVSSTDDINQQNDVLTQLEDLIIRNSSYELPDSEGIKIKLDLKEYNLLDFKKANEIFKIGYDKAISMMDSIKGRVTKRISQETLANQRKAFKSKTPKLRFASVEVSGGNKYQNSYVKQLFDENKSDTFGIDQVRNAFYKSITTGTLKNLYPIATYNDSISAFDLNLKMKVKDDFSIGIGGYITSSNNRYIFLSGGYKPLRYNAFNTKLNVWLGQSYMAGELSSRMLMLPNLQSSIDFQGVISRHKLYESNNLFYEDNMPSFLNATEAFARLKYSMAASRNGIADFTIGYGHLKNRFFENDISEEGAGRISSRYNLGQIALNFEYNTLDNNFYPTVGSFYKLSAMGVLGDNKYDLDKETTIEVDENKKWAQMSVKTKSYFSINRHFSLGVEFDFFASTKKLTQNYNATIIDAMPYYPTISSYNAFIPEFRANSFVGTGLVPIWKINDNLQARSSFHCFLPYRKIDENKQNFSPYYGKRFSDPEFFGELAVVYNFPIASLSLYGNYMSTRDWNFGVSFGIFILAPKFLE